MFVLETEQVTNHKPWAEWAFDKLTIALGQQTSHPPIPIHGAAESVPVLVSLFQSHPSTYDDQPGQ